MTKTSPDLSGRERSALASGVSLSVAKAGPVEGPPLILLHGFPEGAWGWRDHLAPLAAAGYRVLAPDQRGYDLSDKPRGVDAYDLDRLASDVIALADAHGIGRFFVVGHDWGASVGWWLAERHPDRVSRLVALSAPHPRVWREAMETDPDQKRRSRYVGVLRLPWLPEALLRATGFKGLIDGFRASARPEAFDDAVIARYRAAWTRPGALTAMIHWYRALFRKDFGAPARIKPPVLVLWGEDEAFAIPRLAQASADLCASARVVMVPGAGHWLPHERPEIVLAEILAFLRE